jgi:hypothetical protein
MIQMPMVMVVPAGDGTFSGTSSRWKYPHDDDIILIIII